HRPCSALGAGHAPVGTRLGCDRLRIGRRGDGDRAPDHPRRANADTGHASGGDRMTSSTEAPILTLRRFSQHFPPQTDVATLPPGGPAVWGDRCCGLACVRTAVDHFALPVPEQAAMLADGLESGAYSARGWVHTGLLNLARRHGLDGVTGTVADLDSIAQLARAG